MGLTGIGFKRGFFVRSNQYEEYIFYQLKLERRVWKERIKLDVSKTNGEQKQRQIRGRKSTKYKCTLEQLRNNNTGHYRVT